MCTICPSNRRRVLADFLVKYSRRLMFPLLGFIASLKGALKSLSVLDFSGADAYVICESTFSPVFTARCNKASA